MCQCRYVSIIILLWICATNGNIVRNEDICGPHNGRRVYLELGEKGILYAKNVSLIQNDTKTASKAYATNSSHNQCSLELVTCPSCVILLTFKSLTLPHDCGNGAMIMDDSPCRCDYIWVSEPPYEDVSGVPFCGLYSPITHKSSTRTLSIALLYSQSHRHAFTIEYSAERNRVHLKGTKIREGLGNMMNNTGSGILTSPFFPARYPRDLGMEYIITCPTETPSCRIRILFSDFQLAAVSIMEFYDWNGQRLDVSSGARFRPPIIVNSGPSLLIRFYANGGTGLGYKAFYSFVMGNLYDKSIQPITNCGGYVENLGGAITMMDMVSEGIKTYDCVWLIRPPQSFLHMKTHMYLKIITFANMAGTTELTIRQGPTSALMPLEVLRHPASRLQPQRQKEHVTPVTNGFHVSLRGSFGPTSRLAIAYAAFSYMDCFTGSDFLCQNHRCIPSQLNCDGFDHCGDNSDEPATCFVDWDHEPDDRKWHINKANYYFPKIDRYPDLKTATLVFVASSLGLIILISALIVLLYRMGARARQQRELHSRLQTISELLDGARIDEVSITDEPPVYEAPPGYEEVVKLDHENEERRRKKRRANLKNIPNHNSDNQASTSEPVNEDSLTFEAISNGYPSPKSVQIPESPPPPYVTPPSTISRNIGNIVSSNAREEDVSEPMNCRNASHRSWIKNSSFRSRSLPSMEHLSGQAPMSSIDVDVLGAYFPDSIIYSSKSCTSQPSSSEDASIPTTPDYEEISRDSDTTPDNERIETVCSCEGACGCVTNCKATDFPIIKLTSNEDKDAVKRNEIETSYVKNAIIKLLGNSTPSNRFSPNLHLNSTVVSTASVSYNNRVRSPLKQSYSRKLSVRSYDSLVSKISSMHNSYEKLHDNFETVSETTKILNKGDSSTNASYHKSASINKREGTSQTFTSDLDNLYESIKVLDSYLASRSNCTGQSHNQRLPARFFGTSKHSKRRIYSSTSITELKTQRTPRARSWHFGDIHFSN